MSDIQPAQIWNELTDIVLSGGAALVKAADISSLAPELRMNMPIGVSLAVPVTPDIVRGISNGPTVEYFAEYKRLNALLGSLLESAAACIRKYGFTAIPIVPANANFDAATLSTRLPHKTVATRAGMGWIGKTPLLITESFGSAIRLGTLLTDAPFATGTPIDASRCGNCHACVDRCPAHAITGESWHVAMERRQLLNAGECRKTAYALSTQIGVNETLCGICMAVCPHTRAYLNRHPASPKE
jgi:epoxyqueuosine reductase QueG